MHGSMGGKTCFIYLLDQKVGGGNNVKRDSRSQKWESWSTKTQKQKHDHVYINFRTNYDDKDFMLHENFGPPCNVTFKLVHVLNELKSLIMWAIIKDKTQSLIFIIEITKKHWSKSCPQLFIQTTTT